MRAEVRAQQVDEYFCAVAPSMRRTAYLIVRDWHTAEDMVQSAFVNLYVAWPRIRQDGLDAYARRTLVNVCLSHLRRRRWELTSEEVPDRAVEDAERPTDLMAALALLPPQQRAVIAFRYLEDLSVLETADALGIAPGTVKSQASRAMVKLRALLEAEEVAR